MNKIEKTIDDIKNFTDLKDFLENWHSSKDSEVYDFGGIVQLLIACLNNLKKYGLESELEDISEFFEEEEKRFFLKIAHYLER
jgi:hypothetical protein